MPDTRELPEQSPRVETGNVRFGDDWTGVFIRGDQACYWSQRLLEFIEHAKRGGASWLDRQLMAELQNTLASCAEGAAADVVKKCDLPAFPPKATILQASPEDHVS